MSVAAPMIATRNAMVMTSNAKVSGAAPHHCAFWSWSAETNVDAQDLHNARTCYPIVDASSILAEYEKVVDEREYAAECPK